jgi:NhaA family Na+:H+ antiporter
MSQSPGIRPPWSRSDRPIPRTVVRPLQEFLATSTSSSWFLIAAVVVALVWVNSPWGDTYERVWTTPLVVRIGDHVIGTDLRFWIGNGLMTFFFLVVGLEIKREITIGELTRPRTVALPAIAALGGMVVPALLYLAIAHDGPARGGWGVPIATDIALALGALALAARHAPASLKPLLLTLAIVDDIGAIAVIAVFYSRGGDPAALAAAVLVIVAVVVLQRLYVRATWIYVALGIVLWLACEEAGIHPTIAGVVLGLLTPVRPFQRPAAVSREAKRVADETADEPDPVDADTPAWLELATLSRDAVSPLARVEHLLLPWTSFLIVPLFALSSAGVRLSVETVSAAFTGAVAIGVFVGLVVGKPVGVVGASLLATWSRAGELPADVGKGALVGLGTTAGIGFTVGLFIAELAFSVEPALLAQAKIAILFASIVAGALGYTVLRMAGTQRSPATAQPSVGSDPR